MYLSNKIQNQKINISYIIKKNNQAIIKVNNQANKRQQVYFYSNFCYFYFFSLIYSNTRIIFLQINVRYIFKKGN